MRRMPLKPLLHGSKSPEINRSKAMLSSPDSMAFLRRMSFAETGQLWQKKVAIYKKSGTMKFEITVLLGVETER